MIQQRGSPNILKTVIHTYTQHTIGQNHNKSREKKDFFIIIHKYYGTN